MRISYKIGLFSIFIALLPMLIVGGTGYFKSNSMLLNNQVGYTVQTVEDMQSNIERMLENTKNITGMLADSILLYGIEDGVKLFSLAVSHHTEYKNIYFGVEETGKFLISPKVDLPDDYDPRKRPWYTIATGKEVVVSPPYADAASSTVTITISKAVFKEGKKIGVVGLDFDLGKISDDINKIKIGKTGYIFVMYKDGTTLTHPSPEVRGKNLAEKLSFIRPMLELKNGILNYDYKGDKFAVVRTLDEYGWTIGGGTYYSEIKEPLKVLRNILLIILVCTILIVLTGIYFVTRSMTLPLKKIVLNMDDIAQGEGDLTKRLDVTSDDETGLLATSFNVFVEKLHGIIGNIARTSENLDNTSGRILGISEEMALDTEKMSAGSETVTASAGDMSSNMTSVAAAIEESSSNISMVSAAAEEMTATINEIAQNAEKTRVTSSQSVTRAKAASENIDLLNRSAKEIENMVETITDISEQTNLLALNATIEAARAGEAGKGFAVVANEIKDLAMQTSTATQDIKDKIQGIRQSTDATISEIEEVTVAINSVNEMIDNVAAAVEEQSVTTREIASNVSQAARGIEKVTENVSQSSTMTAEIAGDIDEVNQAVTKMSDKTGQVKSCSEDLSEQSDELKKTVSQFKF